MQVQDGPVIRTCMPLKIMHEEGKVEKSTCPYSLLIIPTHYLCMVICYLLYAGRNIPVINHWTYFHTPAARNQNENDMWHLLYF